MARGDLLCPIDGTVLGLPNWQFRGGGTDFDVGGHAHVSFAGTFTCTNGHRWQATPDMSSWVMQRIQ